MSFRRYVVILGIILAVVSGVVVAQSTRHQLLQTFTSSTPSAAKQFGEALVIGDALDGWPLFVGSPNMPGLGRVERFINTGASWEATNCVLTQTGTQKATGFGEALATSGVGANALLLVGEPYFNKSGGFADNGRVSVFKRDAGTNCLSRIATINPPVDAADQLFGASVDISVGTAASYVIIGAPTRDEAGIGAAYIYRSTDGGKTWTLEVSYNGGTAGTAFGYDVAIDGADSTPTAVVGAMNAATDTVVHGEMSVYRRENDTWVFDELLFPDPWIYSNTLNFGWSVDVAVSSTRTFVIGAAACKTCDTSSASPRIFVYERLDFARAVTYQEDMLITSRFAIGEDLVLKNQPGSPNDFFMAFTSTSYYYELWKRVEQYYWQPSTTSIEGTAGNRIAVATSAGFEPHLAVGQASVNTAWISAPSATSFELLGNGDFGEGSGSNSGVPRKWKSSNLTEDGRKCGKTTGCYYNFKGSANENSLLTQVVKLTNHQFNAGDVLTFTTDLKTTVAAPNLLITLAVTEDGNTVKSTFLLDEPTLDWQTIAPITHTLCAAPTKIVVSFRNKTKNGVIRVDNVSLRLSEPVDSRACRLALPPAP